MLFPDQTCRYELRATVLFGANRVVGQLTRELRISGNSAAAMSGKGCQLLVSPCAVTPSLGHMIKGHQAQTAEVGDELSSSGSMERVKKRVHQTFVGCDRQSRSHVVLPALSLRRQVLTNGKHMNVENQCPASTGSAQMGHCLSDTFQGKWKKNLEDIKQIPVVHFKAETENSHETTLKGSLNCQEVQVEFWLHWNIVCKLLSDHRMVLNLTRRGL